MTTKDLEPEAASETLRANLARIEELSSRLMTAMTQKRAGRASLQSPGPEFFASAWGAWWNEAMTSPEKLWENQLGYWTRTLTHAIEAQQALLTPEGGWAPEDRTPDDRRFANPLWKSHPWFNYFKQQYLITAQAMTRAVEDLDGLDERNRRRARYFTRQIIDMMAPTNFLATNPDALEKAVATEGESLVRGLENLLRDLEKNDGELIVTLSDPEAFELGGNIATSEGAVVYRNRMIELIQYAPLSEEVHAIPLVIFPPWINKFYILDLRPENSLIRWLSEQGYTVFVVSWVNPDPSYAEVSLGDYVEEGILAAIREVKAITGQDRVNAVGYCIAGTALALTLALMTKRGDDSVNAATFFTALTDFSDQGEIGVFLDDDFVDGLEAEAKTTGIMPALYMSRTFSYLRANDLIYAPAIRSYLLGNPPPAFDLLHWNGDGTNLPGEMAVDYLRGLCQQDAFASGGFELLGERLHISDVKVPLCAVACESDHIAPWRPSYRGIRQMGSPDKSFILSESGHIAGIVNPPGRKKYGHYLNADWPEAPEDWQDAAAFHDGSWWPHWQDWLAPRSGPMVPARGLGDSAHPPLTPAPGDYVRAKPRG